MTFFAGADSRPEQGAVLAAGHQTMAGAGNAGADDDWSRLDARCHGIHE